MVVSLAAERCAVRALLVLALGLLPVVVCADATVDAIEEYRRQCDAPEVRETLPVAGRAVSLRVTQEHLKNCRARTDCDTGADNFYGLQRLHGFVVDIEHRDVVLFGTPGSEALRLDDFVVALRNVWLMYAQHHGRTIVYEPQACSIDPDPDTFEALSKISGTHAATPALAREWETACNRPQAVKIYGMPRSPFAASCVLADYEMKSWVNGSMSAFGVGGVPDLALTSVRRQIEQGSKNIKVPAGGINRYWFAAGETNYQEHEGSIWLSRLQVVLLTEQQFLSRRQEIAGTGHANAFAEAVSECFTRKLPTLASGFSAFGRLEQLYRHVAIAKILRQTDKESRLPLSLRFLLEEQPLAEVSMPDTLPGVSGFKHFSHGDGNTTHYLMMPSCGGASFRMEPAKTPLTSATGPLTKIRSRILDARPDQSTAYWDWPREHGTYVPAHRPSVPEQSG